MTLQSSANTTDPLKFSEIQAEFSLINSNRFRNFINLGDGLPTSGTLKFSDFLSKSQFVSTSGALIVGGGGGGGFAKAGGGGGAGGAYYDTSIVLQSHVQYTVYVGGGGGAGSNISTLSKGLSGQSSYIALGSTIEYAAGGGGGGGGYYIDGGQVGRDGNTPTATRGFVQGGGGGGSKNQRTSTSLAGGDGDDTNSQDGGASTGGFTELNIFFQIRGGTGGKSIPDTYIFPTTISVRSGGTGGVYSWFNLDPTWVEPTEIVEGYNEPGVNGVGYGAGGAGGFSLTNGTGNGSSGTVIIRFPSSYSVSFSGSWSNLGLYGSYNYYQASRGTSYFTIN